MLVGDDMHSIQHQMLKLLRDDTVYRCFNEALRIGGKRPAQERAAATIVELLHESFFTKQVMSLRRLLESPPKNKRSDRAVYSICTVFAEIRDNQTLLTRGNYVCYDGTMYEETDSRHDRRTKIICSGRHLVFDTLANTRANQRCRTDLVDAALFVRLDNHFKKSDRLKKYTDKFVAHAADPLNRTAVEMQLRKMSLRYLQDLYRMVTWALKTIGKITDQLILTELPVLTYDQFTGWENGFITQQGKRALKNYWSQRQGLFKKWSHKYWSTDVLYRSPYKP